MKASCTHLLIGCALPLFCLAAAVPNPEPTVFAPERLYTMPPLPSPTPSHAPASGLRIAGGSAGYQGPAPTDTRFFAPFKTYDGFLLMSACVDVVNTSAHPITHFQVVFTLLAANRLTMMGDPRDVYTNIAPGGKLENSCRIFEAQTPLYNDDPPDWTIGPDTVVLTTVVGFVDKKVPIAATISEVDFAGAPSWHAPKALYGMVAM